MKRRLALVLPALCLLGFSTVPRAAAQSAAEPLLLQSPTMSKTQVAFAYGGDIWIVDRAGGDARRLVTGTGLNSGPMFSPDGSLVAYTGDYDGNQDVYVVPAAGGEPRRLTSHPDVDVVVGWTPDGKKILFRSTRTSYSRFEKLFTVPVEGGLPTALPLPMGVQGVFSPDATQIAYVPFWNRRLGAGANYIAIKQYHGGKTARIWVANLADSAVTRLEHGDWDDFCPMWVGDTLYFLSNRSGRTELYAYNTKTKETKQLTKTTGFDLKSASAGPGGIVYEQLGSLHIYDFASGQSKRLEVRVAGDMPQRRPHFEKVEKHLENPYLSPTGQRAVFEAHGEILTVPAEKGDIRNLTNSPGVMDRDPAWSPDGMSIAYFSDESGEYALHIRSQDGLGAVRKIALGQPPSFFYSPRWSPDSKKICYDDKRLNLWYVDVSAEHPVPVKVDTDRFDSPLHEFDAVWSPDSRWLAYAKQLPSYQHAIFVYSLEDKAITQFTDGMSDALYPAFDKSGKYLYFAASTNLGLTTGWLDMTSEDHPVTRSAYVAVLRKDLPSPLAPESDDEKPAAKNGEKEGEGADAGKEKAQQAGEAEKDKGKEKEKEKKEPVKVTIDFDNLSQRILALPIPDRNYVGLISKKEGIVYLAEGELVFRGNGPFTFTLQRFDMKTRKTEKLLDGAREFLLSANGEKMLYRQGDNWFIAAADKAPKPGEGQLKLADMEVAVDPPAEWRQMFHEVWRIERDFFYDPHFHGADLQALEKAYQPFLAGIASRADLSYLFADMLANINVQHMYVGAGQQPELKMVKVGLLGADYTLENGRYRFAHIYDGENWNPQLHAPLTQPGVNVKEGEYLLAVNGRELHASDEIYSLFLETAGKQVVLEVGPNADRSGSRQVTVVPVDAETTLRNYAWIEGNRRKVEQMSGGKLAYVYLPNTAGAGYTNFNRYYFAQVGREGAVLDERFNGGGQLADYIIDYLRRPVMSLVATREGQDYQEPNEAIFGPKVMIINEYAGSGGDAMPWYFRKAGIGPLVGTRTWGGLVGIGGYPQLMDGGTVTAPRWAIYGLHGDWEVENRGIEPDVAVDLDPQLVRQGHDPQLEKAVEMALQSLKEHPLPVYPRPPYPVFHPVF